jgi:hypothetical protein
VFNALPTDITEYHMELGWIVGGVFQSSTPGDGLDFDWWLPGDPFACLGVIPPLSVAGPCETPPPGDGNGYLSTVDNTSSEDDLWFLGLLPPNEQANLQFALDIPPLSNVPPGATRWAIRQVAIPIPEPGTLGLLASGLGFLVLRRRRSP